MVKLATQAILGLIGVASFRHIANAAGPGSPRTTPPVILSAMLHSNEHTIVISGNYFGTVLPTVLGDRVMNVESFSSNQVIVMLPFGIQPATYSLTVTANRLYPLTSNIFSAALFATAR